MTEYRKAQYQKLVRRLRQRVFDDPRIDERNLISKVKAHMGIEYDYDNAAKECWANLMYL